MLSIVPFFIAGLFYPVWPWGLVVATLWAPILMLLNFYHFKDIWQYDKAILIQTTIHSMVGFLIMNGGAMLAGNGVRWLFS